MRVFLLCLLTTVCGGASAQVVANFSASPTVLCPGGSVQFTDLSTGNPTIWNWSFPGGSPATSTLQNPVVTYSFAGSYNVSLSASNGGIPSTNTTFSYITVNSTPPGTAVISGPLSVCRGQVATYSVAPVSNAISYSWTASSSATILSGQGTNSISLVTGAPNTTLCVSAGNACGYSAPSCTVITSPASPTITVTPSSTTICQGSTVTLTASGGVSYTWSPSAGLSSTTGISVNASPTVSTTYTVTGSNAGGCTGQTTATVAVAPLPSVSVTPAATVICSGGSATLVAGGAATYSWSPSTGLSSTSGATVVASPTSNVTYTVTGTAANSCSARATSNVSVTPSSPGSPGLITGSPLACAGLTNTYSVSPVPNASTYSWTVPPGAAIISGQGTNSVQVTFGASSGSVCVSAGNGCGYSPASCLPVSPAAQPTVIVAPASSTVCAGGSVVLAAAGANTYSWSPASGLNTTTGATVVATPSASIVYTVTGTNTLTGCSGTASSSITVNPLPVITITPPFPSICSGGATTLTASGAASYTWSPASGLSGTTGSSVVASPSTTTSYTVTGTDINGCTGNGVVTVSVSSTPPAMGSAPAGPSSVCSGQNGTYTVAATAGASSYSWTAPAGAAILSGQGSTLVTIQFSTTGGSICVAGVNGCGTGAQACTTVNVLPSPSVAVNPSVSTICAGDFVTLNASGASTYSWSPNTAISSTTMSSIVAGPQQTTTYSVTGTATNGCFSTATATVGVNPRPVITINPPSPAICAGGSVTLTASGALSYSWAPSSSLSGSTGASVTAQPTVSTTYTVTGMANTGCLNQAMVTVKVHSGPPAAPASVTGPSTLCAYSTVTFSTDEINAADSYSWTTPAGFTVTGQGSTLIALVAGPGNGNICVTAVNACGSSSATCISVTVHPNPVLTLTTSGPACSGSNATLTASGASTYSWSPPTGLSSTTGATVTAGSSAAGIVTVAGTSTAGCRSEATIEVIFLSPPAAAPVSGPSALCTGSGATYSITTQPATQYTWTVSGGLQLTSQTNSTALVTANSAGSVCVSGQNTCGAGPQSCRNISILPSPQVTASSSGSITCAAPSATLNATSTATDVSYAWTGPSAFSSTLSSPTVSTPGTYSVSVQNNQNGCSSNATLAVQANTNLPLFTASITSATCLETISKDDGAISVTVSLQELRYVLMQAAAITVTTDYNSATPIPSGGIITSTLANPSTDLPYTLRIINAGGCSRDTSLLLKANDCDGGLFIPQAFTPEGDGKNDLFVISGLPAGGENSFTVFNRWGNKVFYKADYDNSWDGRANTGGTDKLPRGTYYYVLEFKGRDLKPVTGFIVLQY